MNIYRDAGGWWFFDETGDSHGPWGNKLQAERRLDGYCDSQLEGAPRCPWCHTVVPLRWGYSIPNQNRRQYREWRPAVCTCGARELWWPEKEYEEAGPWTLEEASWGWRRGPNTPPTQP